MNDKENIYDERIFPLMKQIIEICKENHITMFADFQIGADLFCKSHVAVDAKESSAAFQCYDAISQCKEEGMVNIDKFLFWVVNTFDNSQSCFLYKYNKAPNT